jgi:protein-S-isoprenylcysteine O-methyltransferase Ste14
MLAVSTVLTANLGAYLGISGIVAGWDRIDPIGRLQRVACWVYVVALVIAGATWAYAGFPEEASLLPSMWSAGIGVVLAVFGAALGVKSHITALRERVTPADTPQRA